MKYNTEGLIKEALETGFSQAGELNVSALVFMPEVREMCNADQCRQYGKNWRCPPACGEISDAAEKASRYSYGILVQTIGQMEDDFDYETIQSASEKHKKNFAVLVEKLKGRYGDILPMGAGTCELCETCTYPGAPCRHPEQSISSMEAYGLWVSKVCELSNLPYNNGKQTITYTSCYLLK
jgi:predicted metal-binding protein